MTSIEVFCCDFCPFCHTDEIERTCMYPSDDSPDIEDSKLTDSLGDGWQSNTIHPNCPLKQSPVTIKLAEND